MNRAQYSTQILAILAIALALPACGKVNYSAGEEKALPSNPSAPSAPASPVAAAPASTPATPNVSAPVPSVPSPVLPSLDPAALEDGLYKVQFNLITSLNPISMTQFNIAGGRVDAYYMVGFGQSKLHLTGSYGYRDNELIFIQDSLQLTVAGGESSSFNCPALALQEGVATDVAGKTCGSIVFWSNYSLVSTGLSPVNAATFTPCISTGLIRYGNCGAFDLDFSFILQRQLDQFLPTAPPADGLYTGGFGGSSSEFIAQTPRFYTLMQSVSVAGTGFTAKSEIWFAPVDTNQPRVLIGTVTTAGTFTVDSPSGYVRFAQTSMLLTANGATSSYLTCPGATFSNGADTDVAGQACSQVSFHANGDMYGSGLTAVDADTITACPEGFFNCQKDPVKSFLRH